MNEHDLQLHQVDPVLRAGVAHDAIVAARRQHERENRRPRALTAREALQALWFEAQLVLVAAGNIRNGVALADEDFERLSIAYRRIDYLVEEAAR